MRRLRCVVLGHSAKDYCEPFPHYEVRCRRCDDIMTRYPSLESRTEPFKELARVLVHLDAQVDQITKPLSDEVLRDLTEDCLIEASAVPAWSAVVYRLQREIYTRRKMRELVAEEENRK